jgi:hypothetical protein
MPYSEDAFAQICFYKSEHCINLTFYKCHQWVQSHVDLSFRTMCGSLLSGPSRGTVETLWSTGRSAGGDAGWNPDVPEHLKAKSARLSHFFHWAMASVLFVMSSNEANGHVTFYWLSLACMVCVRVCVCSHMLFTPSDLEFITTLLLPPECWDYGYEPLYLAKACVK